VNALTFETSHCVSPASVASSEDERPLGIAVDWVELRRAGAQ
jgi:hypothetical protein